MYIILVENVNTPQNEYNATKIIHQMDPFSLFVYPKHRLSCHLIALHPLEFHVPPFSTEETGIRKPEKTVMLRNRFMQVEITPFACTL